MKDYHINIYYSDVDRCYVADVPDLEGCSVSAPTQEAAFSKILTAKKIWLELAERDGKTLPVPRYQPDYAGIKQSILTSAWNEWFVVSLRSGILNPIVSINGYADLLNRGTVGDLTEQQHEFLDIILKVAEYLQNLTNDATDVVRIEIGTIRFDEQFVIIQAVIEEAIEDCEKIIAQHQQQVKLDLGTNLPEIIGDHARFVQVFAYLLINTIVHNRPEIPIDILIRQQQDAEPPCLLCKIQPTDFDSDNIRTVDANVLRASFSEVSYRSSWIYDLRLFIARSVIMLHGGTFNAKQDVTDRVAFHFTLPIAQQD